MTQALREQLQENLENWGVGRTGPLEADAPLISSGRLDSLALFNLSTWVEEQTGQPLDPTTFNVAVEWDTIDGVLGFIDRARGEKKAPVVVAPPPVPASVRTHLQPGYRIERCTPDFKTHFISLQKRLWSSDDELNRAVFEWRYEKNPFAHDPLIYLAYKDDEPVATRALCGSLWEGGGGAPMNWYTADDLVVLPGHESKGLFAAFTELIRDDLLSRQANFFISLSPLRVTRLQALAGGARAVGALQPLGYRTSAMKMLDGARDVAARLPLAWRLANRVGQRDEAKRAFERFDARAAARGPKDRCASGPVRAADMAKLVANLPYDGRFRMVRDERFFKWRFDFPLHEYRFLYAEGGDGLLGYLVLERGLSDLANPTRINIADWEGTSPQVLAQLLDAALDWAEPSELVCWSRTLGAARNQCMEARGFEAVDPEQTSRGLPGVLVWPLDENAQATEWRIGDRSPYQLNNWDVRMVYTSMA